MRSGGSQLAAAQEPDGCSRRTSNTSIGSAARTTAASAIPSTTARGCGPDDDLISLMSLPRHPRPLVGPDWRGFDFWPHQPDDSAAFRLSGGRLAGCLDPRGPVTPSGRGRSGRWAGRPSRAGRRQLGRSRAAVRLEPLAGWGVVAVMFAEAAVRQVARDEGRHPGARGSRRDLIPGEQLIGRRFLLSTGW